MRCPALCVVLAYTVLGEVEPCLDTLSDPMRASCALETRSSFGVAALFTLFLSPLSSYFGVCIDDDASAHGVDVMIVMEKVTGGSLQQNMEKVSMLLPEKKTEFAFGVCAGLEFLHLSGWVRQPCLTRCPGVEESVRGSVGNPVIERPPRLIWPL